jgi:hypothetical protein
MNTIPEHLQGEPCGATTNHWRGEEWVCNVPIDHAGRHEGPHEDGRYTPGAEWDTPDRMTVSLNDATGELIITRKQPLVIEAPDLTLMSVGLLHSIDSARIIGSDKVYVGEDDDDEHVLYRIVGWDSARCALILRRWSKATPDRVTQTEGTSA